MSWMTELDALLEVERTALLSADESALAEILPKKEDLLVRASQLHSSGSDVEALIGKSRRNQALLDSALSGLRKANDIVGRHRGQRQSITVYDHVGGRREITSSCRCSIEKKA